MPTHRKITLLLASTFLLPAVAFADAGVPMLFVVMPVFGFSLVPIVLIEALYLQKSLALTFGHAIRGSLLANAVSTLVGIPLTWIGLVVLEATTGGGRAYGLGSLLGRVGAVTWQAPWLIPYESNLHWMIPVAGTVLLVPFFFVSWWIEYLICVTRFTSVSPVAVRRAVRDANLITYGLLLFWPAAFYLMTPA